MTDVTGKEPPHTNSLWHTIGASKVGLEPALTIPDRLVSPDSWVGHLPFAFWLVAATRPRRYVELGVHTGNSYCGVAQAVMKYQLDTECFGIDHWFGDVQAGLYGEDVYADLKAWHDPRFGHFSKLLRMSFADGRAHVEDGSVDILHIDGLHTYEAVREDFETWQAKMSDRSIVLFHDTNVFQSDFGVCDFWQEIKARYPTFEFLNSNGLGVAYTGSLPVETLGTAAACLFSPSGDGSAISSIRSYFSRLGEGLIQTVRLEEAQSRAEDIVGQMHSVQQDLVEIEKDRAAIREERAALIDERTVLNDDRANLLGKALKWDQFAVQTGGAISMELDEISSALGQLYNSDNPQARRDKDVLKRQFGYLIRTGTLTPDSDPEFSKLAFWAGKRLWRKIKTNTSPPPEPEADASISAIRDSGLFDEGYYALTGEARAAGRDPLEHYLLVGEEKRVAPSPHFDPDYYARRNRDVAKSGFGLLRHFVLFGQPEDRPSVTPAKRMVLPMLGEKERPRILLLLEPDASDIDTLFVLNVASGLQETHDVILLLQQGSTQADSFADVATAIILFPEEIDIEAVDRNEVLAHIVKELKPDFGVILSVSSRSNVRGLAATGLGIVQLVDKFSSSVRPFESAYEFLPWVHRLVFPSKLVVQSFTTEHRYLTRRQMSVLHPAACIDYKGLGLTGSDDGVEAMMRPAGHEADTIIAGYGEVSPDSGIETFIALAAKAGPTSREGKALRFVWVTQDYDAVRGDAYACIVAEQIKRAGVSGYCVIAKSAADLETILGFADVFALTTPIDAMPHTAISAVRAGKPVICFDAASSLGEVLKSEPATAPLVSAYLSVSALSDLVHRLSDDAEFYAAAAEACRVLSKDVFDLGTYVKSLVRIGEEAQADAASIDRDYHLISGVEPPVFNEVVFGGTWAGDNYPQDLLYTYLLRSRVAWTAPDVLPTGLRRPLAGFNPLIYAEDHSQDDRGPDPLADWLDAGRPTGRWTHPLITLSNAVPVPVELKTLLHAHFFYVDLLDDFLVRLQRNASKIDLIVTVPDEVRAKIALQVLSAVTLKGTAKVEVVGNNQGRDIGPFLSGLDREVLNNYDVIGHVHGKKSPHVEKVTGDQWRKFLWEHLIGGANASADACLAAFEADPTIGLIFPEDAHLHGWDDNLPLAESLARKMGRTAPLPQAFEWPLGTMFWARRAALEPLFDLGLDWTDYPSEPLPVDGTILHALERMIPFAAEQAGFGYATSHIPELQR